jgi:hypothetical protein
VSYLTHDGKRDIRADIELATKLQANGHMSPFEHVARPMEPGNAERILLKQPGVTGVDKLDINVSTMFAGNFRGWVQLRKTLPHEDNFLTRPAQ